MVDLKPNNNHSKLNIPIKKQTVKLNTKARYNSIGCLPETQIKYEKKWKNKIIKNRNERASIIRYSKAIKQLTQDKTEYLKSPR